VFSVKATEIFNLPKYNAWLRIGIDNILIETFPPKIIDNNLVELPKQNTQTTIEFTDTNHYFLSEEWIPLLN